MKVSVGFFGAMERLAGSPGIELELPDGSTCREAMQYLVKEFGDRLTAEVWDAGQGTFTPLVSIFVDFKEVENLEQPLHNGSEVLVIMPLAGG